jgi:hypothetical protein
MSEDGQYDRNMLHMLTKLIKLCCGTYANCKTMHHNGINSTKIEDWSLLKREVMLFGV